MNAIIAVFSVERSEHEANLADSSNSSPSSDFSNLRWDRDGLIPAIVQDVDSGEVLMMAWMNESALRKTLQTGQTHFFSRSRNAEWHKGGTSGHIQEVESIWIDCDADVVLVKARQVGGACHEGYRACFFRRMDQNGQLTVSGEPVFDAHSVYRTPEGKPSSDPASGDVPHR